MTHSIFGWSLPPGCSHRDIEEAMGGNAELEALEESIFERPELAGVSEEDRMTLCDWIIKLVSDARTQGYNDAHAENEMAAVLTAEAKLLSEWKAKEE
jgi:hypothetical protein